MRFRRDAFPVLIGAVIVIITIMAIVSNRLFSGLTESIEKSQFELMKAILDSSLHGAEDRALARASMIASLPTTQQIFAARDRERLLAEYSKMFEIQKEKFGVDQAQFHIPPATSFLRLQAPDKFGDDLSKFRPMVVAVNQDHLERKGLAIARTGPAVFGVVPVRDVAGKEIGSFEVGIDFGAVLDNLKAAYGLELALFIEEQPLREFAQGVNPEVLSEENRLGKYVKYHSTHWALMKELAKSSDLTLVQEPVKYTREALGIPYGVLLVPLRNNAGKPLGVVAVAQNFSGSRAAARRSLVWQVALALFSIVLLSGFVVVVIGGLLLKPLRMLGDRFAALEARDQDLPVIEDQETLCQELQALAEIYERMRIQSTQTPAERQVKGVKNIP